MKIGIQGFEGSYHHQAASQFFNQTIQIAPFETFPQVFGALMHGNVDRAVVAIENSLYSSINDTYDLLMQYQPWIIGEIYIHVQLNLLVIPGAKISDITDIYSQAPALAEAKSYLREHVPIATQHEYPDTALSARFVSKQQDKSKASIASEQAAKLYGLEILENGIEDHQHNYTRFVVLSRDKIVQNDANKTSIVLKTNHTPGALHRALGALAKHDLNLSKIESRPIVDHKSWNYIFYLDFEADLNNPETKSALDEIAEQNGTITMLGSYPRGSLPNGIR